MGCSRPSVPVLLVLVSARGRAEQCFQRRLWRPILVVCHLVCGVSPALSRRHGVLESHVTLLFTFIRIWLNSSGTDRVDNCTGIDLRISLTQDRSRTGLCPLSHRIASVMALIVSECAERGTCGPERGPISQTRQRVNFAINCAHHSSSAHIANCPRHLSIHIVSRYGSHTLHHEQSY